MSEAASDRRLERECAVFATYLGVPAPTSYVAGEYAEAHRRLDALTAVDRFDSLLVSFAARHEVATKIADAYARLLAPKSALRNKLVLLLSILETSVPGMMRAPARSRPAVVARLVLDGGFAAASAVAGVLLLAPVHLLLRRRKGTA